MGRPPKAAPVFLIILINIYGYSLYMDDIWIISWFNHTAFDANPIWKSPICKYFHSYFSKYSTDAGSPLAAGSAACQPLPASPTFVSRLNLCQRVQPLQTVA